MHLVFELGAAWTAEACGPRVEALGREGRARVLPRPDGTGWTLRAGAPLALHPDLLPLRMDLVPAHADRPASASARFGGLPWMRRPARAAARRRVHEWLASLAPADAPLPPAPARPLRPDFPLRSFSVFLSLLLSTCAGIFVMWLFGLSLLGAETGAPPDYFGITRLSELPLGDRIRIGWFMAFSMGYPLGFLSGLLCVLAEYVSSLGTALPWVFVALAGWLGFMAWAPGVRVPAVAAAVALPLLCWLAYGLPWALRQEVEA